MGKKAETPTHGVSPLKAFHTAQRKDAVEWQALIKDLLEASDDRERYSRQVLRLALLDEQSRMHWHNRRKCSMKDRLVVHLLLLGEWRHAWALRALAPEWEFDRPAGFAKPSFLVSKALRSLADFWKVYESKPDSVDFQLIDPGFSLKASKNEAALAAALRFDDPEAEPYDLSRSGRNNAYEGNRSFYVSHRSKEWILSLVPTLWKHDRLDDIEELLARLGLIVKKQIPGGLLESHSNPVMNQWLEYWKCRVACKRAANKKKRTELAWKSIAQAVDLLLHGKLQCEGATDLVNDFIAIYADFELWDGDAEREQFLRHLQFVANMGSVSLSKRLLEEAVKPIQFKEMNLLSWEDLGKMYTKLKKEMEKKPARR